MSDIVLSAGIRQNLLSLQSTAQLLGTTQTRLATGKKVNSALDNAVNFFTSSGLNSRAMDFTALLDAMSNGIKTIEAADDGLTSITKIIQAMQSTLMQARQDASWQSKSYAIDTVTIGSAAVKTLSFSGGAVGSTPVTINLNATSAITAAGGSAAAAAVGTAGTLTIQSADINGGKAFTVTVGAADTGSTVAANINAAAGTTLATAGAVGITFANTTGAKISVTASAAGLSTAIGTGGVTTAVVSTATATTPQSVDTLVTLINGTAGLSGFVKASNDAGQLRITNLSTSDLAVAGIGAGGVDGSAGSATVGGNAVRANLVTQFNDYRDQLDKLSADASYMGINLLQGDPLKVFFNEFGTSTLNIQVKDINGNAFVVNSSNLNIQALVNSSVESNTNIDTMLSNLRNSLQIVRAQSSNLGSNLSVVQIRQDFTKSLINTLKTGADNLVLADQNEEGANMLALQTRQQLSITALSLSSQAQQAVLRLFG
jgi:flagellin